jgi:hypothetical protein
LLAEEPINLVRGLEDIIIKQLPKSATFECEFKKSMLNVQWLKNGRPIMHVSNYKASSIAMTHKLHIENVTEDDDAEYSITVKGREVTKAKLVVEAPPQIFVQDRFHDQIVLEANHSSVIEVPFTGSPQPEVTWTYNNGKLPDPRRFKVDIIRNMTSLVISRADRKDGGDYCVHLANKFGEVKLTVSVLVLGKGRILFSERKFHVLLYLVKRI